MNDEIIDLTPLEQKINALIFKAGYFIQTYRALDALNVLAEAHRKMDGQEVHWRVRTAVLKNTGQAYIQLGQFEKGLACFAQSYDIIEDENEKAGAAAHLAGYFLRDGRLDEAMKWTEKALEIATDPDLKAGPYQIKGGIAVEEGDYPKAIELLNKAAAYAEKSHCLTDLATIISDLATVFMLMGKLETALSEMFRAERYAKESRNLDLMFRFAVRRAKLMYKMGKDGEGWGSQGTYHDIRRTKELKMLCEEEIEALPTILDVVEHISKMENDSLLRNGVTIFPGDAFRDEGRYAFVSETWNRDVVRLMPVSPTPFIYYRGQSRFHEPCVPSLYRRNDDGELPREVDIAYHKLKICEFEMLLATHPVFCELSHHISVNPVALAQHYGLATEYLDITNSKWVAAFFASTWYDYKTDMYHPVGRDYEEGYGVMYISKPYESGGATDEFFSKNVVIGYQYFERPTKQSSFGYKMQMGEDFNESPYFERVLFRHDLETSKLVYDMSYKQRRFIPKDNLSRLARQIAESNEVTRRAVERCSQMCYWDKDMKYLEEVCKEKGIIIREDNRPVAQFGRESLESDWKAWNEYGRTDLQMRILPPIAVTELTLGDETVEERR